VLTSAQLPVLPAPPYRLRQFTIEDLPLVREASGDPYIPLISTVPADFTEAAGLAFIARQNDRVDSGAGYPFAIARVEDDVAVGHVGVWPRPSDRERASIGYWVAPSGRGHRAGSCAVRALSEWAFRYLGIQRLEAYVEPWNVASQRTVEAVGYVREGTMRSWQVVGIHRKDMYMYSLLADDSTLNP
jgi:RimJ/RimL family protein N-acetyltransferase